MKHAVIRFSAYILLAIPICRIEATSPSELLAKRVNAHMVIADYPSACQEAYWGVQQYPEQKIIWIAYLKALAKAGDEKVLMPTWKCFVEKFPDEINNREVLECLAWAVIDKGASSSSPGIRVMAMLGAFFSQDSKGIVILQQGLQDDNSFIRAAAVKLSSHLMDITLQDELLRLLQTERVWSVRLEIIRAVGELRIMGAKKGLQKIIEDEQSHAEEKAAAIQAMVSLSDELDHTQLSQLVASNRSGMRMLACELISFFDQTQDIDKLYSLIDDHHADVRMKLYQTIGRLRVTNINGMPANVLAENAVNDPSPMVAITAAWLLTIHQPEKGMEAFQKILNHPAKEIRHLSAAALAATGKYGIELTKKVFFENHDIYVRMNLAMGLISQRIEIKAACDCLYQGLTQQKEKWAWNEEEGFRVLGPSKAKHDEAIPNHPEAVNQLTRLEVLQILALVQYPHAQQAVKNFLTETNWGISGLASALLLTEGDEEAVELVQALLKDNDPKVKIQAALILALWGKGDDVVQILQQAYPDADRELKEQILEGVGRVGSENALTFLVERLQEPYQTLRIIAAASLLECLYH